MNPLSNLLFVRVIVSKGGHFTKERKSPSKLHVISHRNGAAQTVTVDGAKIDRTYPMKNDLPPG